MDIIVTNAYAEHNALTILQLCNDRLLNKFLYILDDESSLYSLANQISYYLPDKKVIIFPAWDVFPYIKISPSIGIMAKRIEALFNIMQDDNEECIILSTVNSVIQKVLPKYLIKNSILELFVLQDISIDLIIRYLVDQGYNRVSSVYSIGEFSARGSILDIFIANAEFPIRLDFNNNIIESIFKFNVDTQLKTCDAIYKVILYPAFEIIKSSYYNYGNTVDFCEKELCSIFDYLNKKTIIVNDNIIDNIRKYTELVINNYDFELQDTNDIDSSNLYYNFTEMKLLINKHQKIFFLYLNNIEKIFKDFGDNFTIIDICKSLNFRKISNLYNISKFNKIGGLPFLIEYIKNNNLKLVVACYSTSSLEYFFKKFSEHDVVLSKVDRFCDTKLFDYSITLLPIEEGFIFNSYFFITEQDLLGKNKLNLSIRKNKVRNIIENELSFCLNDIVVHKDYGIGKFIALETLKILDTRHDFIKIEYRDEDKLFIPIENISLITLHSRDGSNVLLDSLQSLGWQERKSKLKNRINNIAKELLSLEAKRKLAKRQIINYSQNYRDFCNEFSYVETEDQLQAILEIEEDLLNGKIIDRLICGDVGVGKTEVIMRAAFLIIDNYKDAQVAVIVPTTLLCKQHFEVFKDRFKNYSNIKIRQLSRIISRAESKLVKQEILQGDVSIVIGTHALLSKDIVFSNLNLLIIDEEQHFGVKQKEILKKFRDDMHVIALSATPIPRTLHISLSGIKNLSIMKTLPYGRLSVKSFVTSYDERTIRDAIYLEYERGGRVFYVCPHIHDMEEIYNKLTSLLPNISIKTAHGKMSARDLDNIMLEFSRGEYIILLATSIIECGIDIPFANTMIIHNADIFGSAQLYQLKGRVGRSNIQAYVYFIISEKSVMNEKSIRKLNFIKNIDDMGSGFSISLHDMDARGFGNLIGEEQSGHIKEVGIELYQQMLEEEISSITRGIKNKFNTNIKISLNVMIPENYIGDLDLKMRVYKRISNLKNKSEIDSYIIEMRNIFGPLPEELKNLFNIVYMKLLCSELGIYEVTFIKKIVVFNVIKDQIFTDKLLYYLINNPSDFQLKENQVIFLINGINTNEIMKSSLLYLEKMCVLNKE